MKNKDMPAIPCRYKHYITEEERSEYPHGMAPEFYEEIASGLTKRETFAMNAPEVPASFLVEFFNEHNYSESGNKEYVSTNYPELSGLGFMAANKAWRYAYADMMLED